MTVLAETTPQSWEDIFDQVEIVGEREGGLIECYVPIRLICTEDVPVNDEHVTQLASSIEDEASKSVNGTGQLTPVLLGKIEDESQLRIIDGFHRTAALKNAGVEKIYATVKESTWDEVIDLRILTARTHKVVQFARIVEWVNDSWNRTPWSDRLDATQAFVLYNDHNVTGRRSGISTEEASEVREWVKNKCIQWKVSSTSIYDHLSVASVADPQLVNEARSSSRGDLLEHITPGHLKVIAKKLPYKFDIQRLVASTATARNLSIPETRSVVSKVSKCETFDEARAKIELINWSTLIPEYSATQRKRMAAGTFGEIAVSGAGEGVFRPAHVAIGNAKHLLDRILTDPNLPYSPFALELAKRDIRALGQGLFELTKLIDQIIQRQNSTNTESSNRVESVQKPNLRLVDRHREATLNAQPAAVREKPTSTEKVKIVDDGENITQALIQFLAGNRELPILKSKSHIRQAERVIQLPSTGEIGLRQDLEEAILEAKRNRIERRLQ